MRYTEIEVNAGLADTIGSLKKLMISARAHHGLIVKTNTSRLELTCRSIAETAWNIQKHGIYFSYHHGIKTEFTSDLNGGGIQRLRILDKPKFPGESFFERMSAEDAAGTDIFYHSTSKDDDDYVYENDLFMDGAKDYHPTRNLGKHRFTGKSVHLRMTDPTELLAWVNDSYLPWTESLLRLSHPHSTLEEWVHSAFDMGVRCADFYCNKQIKIISVKMLEQYLLDGQSLENLKNRLVCSSCRKRSPRISPL